MKRTLALVVLLAMIVTVFAFAAPAMAVKPGTTNLAGALKVGWHPSSIMPTPPWGLHDIPGADLASKLIVNQPNGATQVAITGAMAGLEPLTTYTVYLSNPWSTVTKWDLTGSWLANFWFGGGTAPDDYKLVTVTQDFDGALSGRGDYPDQGPFAYGWALTSGLVSGDTMSFTSVYDLGAPGVVMHASANIAQDGSLSGVWDDNYGVGRVGTWTSPAGTAVKKTVAAGYPGTFRSQPTFTFTTDAFGAGSWHVNLQDADLGSAAAHQLSVWINSPSGTVLISDNFAVVK